MANKKLLICYNSSEYGGVEIQILDIVKGLSSDLDIYIASKPGALQNEYLEAGAKNFVNLYPKSEYDFGYVIKLIKLIRKENIDIVHGHELRSGALSMFAAWISRVPSRIYHVHTPFIFWVHNSIKKYPALVINLFVNFVVANFFATKVLALTKYIKSIRIQREFVIPKKITVIPNAVKPSFEINNNLINEIFKKYDISDECTLIGYTARFSPEKGHGILIRAFEKINKEFSNTRLLLLSDGVLLEQMKDLSKSLGISNSVIFTGRVTEEEKFALLSKMDIFAFPTLAEGFGIALAEAMSYKIPSVVSDLPVLHDVGEDGVLYFKIGDYEDLASKIKELIDNRSLAESLSLRTFELSKRYTMPIFVENYKKLYLN